MNKSSWIIFTVIVVALFGGLIIWTKSNNPSVDTESINTNSILSASEASGGIGDHVKGNREAKVILVEYGDFQCPGCASVNSNINEFMETEYSEKVAFVYRNFPLPGHTNARAAAGAAEAAGLQGKYWEMHDTLFTNQNSWSTLDANSRVDTFVSYAEDLGLDINKFKLDFANSDKSSGTDVNKKVSFDRALGVKDKVSATPTFFVNGKKVSDEVFNSLNNSDFEPLQKLIDEASK